MTPAGKTNQRTNPAKRENGESHMFPRSRIPQFVGVVVALALSTACGSVTIEAGGWSGFWPNKSPFVASRDFFDSVPVTGQGMLQLEAVNGRVAITGQPGETSVTVKAALHAGSNASLADAGEALSRLEVLVTGRADAIVVQTLQPEGMDGRQYLVDYTITVPSHLAVSMSQVNGHLTAMDVGGTLLVKLTNGDVHLWGNLGAANVSVVHGSVEGTVTLPSGGEIKAFTLGGDIDLRVPKTTSADLTALVQFGTIAWRDLALRNVVETSRSLTGTLGDGAGRIDLETRNGDIHLAGFDG